MSYKKSLDDYVDNIQLQLRDGNFKEALKEIQRALNDYPTNPKYHISGYYFPALDRLEMNWK